MNTHELIGYLASLLVLTTFCMRDMAALRAVAIASNIAFIAYGALADVLPVLLLHVVLLPVNLLRLVESVRSLLRRRAGAAMHIPPRHAHDAAPLPGGIKAAIASRRLSRFTRPACPERCRRACSRRRAAGAAALRPSKQE